MTNRKRKSNIKYLNLVKILSWNIRQGGGSRLKEIKSYLNNSGAHVILLSEFRNNMNGLNLRHSLLLNGYRYQAVSHAKADENSVIVASKIPFNSRIYIDIDPDYSANVIKVEFSAFSLYGCYLPHKKKHRLFDFLIRETEDDTPVIITGDLNSGINGLDQEGESFWYEDDLKTLAAKGVKDVFRHLHGSTKTYSWISHKGNGYRYDHFLASEDILVISQNCYYDHEAREKGLSDHSPMFLELG